MAAKYYVTLTDFGATQIAQAHDVASITLSQLVIGDANGIPYDPITQKSRTALINQRASVPVQSVEINGAVTTVTATIEANVGGFNLHEIGLKDNAGKLIYIGNYHGGYKPAIAEGAGGELTISIDITAESGKDALISIDPNLVTANKDWVIAEINSLSEALNNLINQLNNNKYDKTGGKIDGDVEITGSTTIANELILKDKITLITNSESTLITHSNNELYIDTTLDRIHFMKPIYTGGHAPSPIGWTLLTNGYILQWGEQDYASEPGEINVTVNFPISFPNNCFGISPIRKAIEGTTNTDGGVYLVSKNKNTAQLLLQRYNSDSVDGLRGFSWIAIGN